MPGDLLSALIAGNSGAAPLDPTMAQIGQTNDLAKLMAQQSMSTAPAAPMQAFGRLAEAMAGVSLGSQAQQQMAAALTGR